MRRVACHMNWLPDILPTPVTALRVSISCVLILIYVIFLTRLAGKRSVSKMNSFDWIITVAMGSLVAGAVIAPDDFKMVVIAGAVLFGLQWCLTKLSLQTSWIEKLIKANPTLLVRDGAIQTQGQQKTHVTDSEILAAARGAGLATLEDVHAMVLETDGTFSVIPADAKKPSAFAHYTLRDLGEVDRII